MSRAELANAEAADWLIAQADGPLTPEKQARFEAWLDASEGHKAAYWRLELGWDESGRINALGYGQQDTRAETAQWARLRRWIPAAIAASVVLAIGWQFFGTQWMVAPDGAQIEMAAQTHSTPLGERHLVGLPDGSRIQLNTRSKLRTRIGTDRREVWLEEGEAFFEVAHREGRPFIVYAGDRRVTVLGTQFSVRRTGDNVVVAVLNGRVELAKLDGARPVRSTIIASGDIAVAAGAATLVTTRSEESVEHALSWREGMLSFDQEPLSTIAAEFNRYNAIQLVLDGQSLDTIRITGTFPSDKPDAFARLLREAYGLQVDVGESEIRIHR